MAVAVLAQHMVHGLWISARTKLVVIRHDQVVFIELFPPIAIHSCLRLWAGAAYEILESA
jgi:hypothetical protein